MSIKITASKEHSFRLRDCLEDDKLNLRDLVLSSR
nr:MAG TPA: hypothetical protein [Caudoviricetes sp.]